MRQAIQRKLQEKIDPNVGYEDRARKLMEEVPKIFNVHLSDTKLLMKKRQELLNLMFERLSHACNADPKNGQAFRYRGQAFLEMKDYKRALYDFSAAIHAETSYKQDPVPDEKQAQESKNSRLALNYNFAGQCNHNMGQFEDAIEHYDIAEKHMKMIKVKSPLEMDLQADILFNRGQTYAAIGNHENFRKAINDYETSIGYQEEKVKQAPMNHVEAPAMKHKTLFNLGIAYRRVGNCTDSIKRLDSAVKLNQAKAATYNNLGLSHFDIEEYDEAMENFEKAMEVEQAQVDDKKGNIEDLAFYYNNVGLCRVALGSAAKQVEESETMHMAITAYDNAIAYNPDNSIHYFNRGNVSLNQGLYEEAVEDFDRALSKDATNPKFYHAKGLTFMTAADKETEDKEKKLALMKQAIEQFGKAQDCQESFVSAIFYQAKMYRIIGKYDDAMRQFTKVQAMTPADKNVYFERGLVYQLVGNHELAIKDLSQALELNPQYADALFYIGKSRLACNQIAQAEQDFKKSLNLQENPEIYESLGLLYHMKRDWDEAVINFNDAIAKDNTNVSFYRSLARCYYDQEKYGQSVQELEKAISFLKEPEAQVYFELGLSLFAQKQYKKCLKNLKEALRNSPQESYQRDIYYHLGLSYCREQKFEKAIFPFTKCVEFDASELNYIHERAKAHQMIEQHAEAVDDFNEVIKRNPTNPHAYFRRAFSLKALKKFAEAADDFEKAKNLDPMNPQLVVNHKQLKGVDCIVLCEPGMEREFY